MVHGKLIEQGRVEKLTYKQVRALERMDRKKEKDLRVLELAKEAVVAAGRAAQGVFSNQIAGTALFIVAADLLYPAWFPLVDNATAKIISDVSLAWKQNQLPTQIPHPPDATLGNGNYGVKFSVKLIWRLTSPITDLAIPDTTYWLDTPDEQQALYDSANQGNFFLFGIKVTKLVFDVTKVTRNVTPGPHGSGGIAGFHVGPSP